MIAFIEGPLCQTQTDAVIVQSGGIGWRIFTSARVFDRLPALGEKIRMYTHLAVREDDMSLYGFPDADQLSLFEMLIQVSGIGPKAALSILSVMDPDELAAAVASADTKAISKAPGIGAKTAGRLILELKDKFSAWELEHGMQALDLTTSRPAPSDGTPDARQEAVMALEALGYSHTEAYRAVSQITDIEDLDTSGILKAALKYL